jgi:hypothetical protein
MRQGKKPYFIFWQADTMTEEELKEFRKAV